MQTAFIGTKKQAAYPQKAKAHRRVKTHTPGMRNNGRHRRAIKTKKLIDTGIDIKNWLDEGD